MLEVNLCIFFLQEAHLNCFYAIYSVLIKHNSSCAASDKLVRLRKVKRLKIRSSLSLFCCCRLGFHLHSHSQRSILFIPDLQKPPCCTFLHLTEISFSRAKHMANPAETIWPLCHFSEEHFSLMVSSAVWYGWFVVILLLAHLWLQRRKKYILCRMQDPLPSKKDRELYFSTHYVLHINKSIYMHLETPLATFDYILFLSCIIRNGQWVVTNCDY